MFDESCKFTDYITYKAHSFFCMGGLCEVLVETSKTEISKIIFAKVYKEAKRLESKYSRYLKGNIVDQINNSNRKKVKVDKETYKLLKFADTLFYASGELFDITSGVLRKAWVFDGSSNLPDKSEVESLLSFIGWQKVSLDKKYITLPTGFEIDFGGIGKEYAVDKCQEKAKELGLAPALINLGGDIAVTGPKTNGDPWNIQLDESLEKLILYNGAVATSGDKNKFLMHEERRLTHILNPKTGWPVAKAPRAVTAVSPNCTEAGALTTLALLKGEQAQDFLKEEAEDFRILF